MTEQLELKPYPIYGSMLDIDKDIYIPERDWKPAFYDPDSCGDPIAVNCKCGLSFSTGTYVVEAWNRREIKKTGKEEK